MNWRSAVGLGCGCSAAVVCTLLSSLPVAPPPPATSFSAPPLFSVSGSKAGIGGLFSMAEGDFNGDGIPDFATVGFACANGVGDYVAVYLGKGDGTFQSPIMVSVPNACNYNVVVGRLRGSNSPQDLILVDESVTPGIRV